ncbi:MAG: hypothetical protein MZV70_70480 [Desulfobacterales bacterium]|nr:hypothetical protein [Desulfobacterales bacterium]
MLFGVGFAVLGYCPGTLAGAIGNGYLDAATGGLAGILVGAGLFAAVYGRIEKTILAKGDLKEMTLPGLLKVGPWAAVLPAAALIVLVLWLLERAGL